MKEIRSLTGLRGIAAIYVVVFHLFILHTSYLKDGTIMGYLNNFISNGYLSVDLFFILSGFVLALSNGKYFESGVNKKGWIAFMKKRFIRIYPIYFFATIVYFFSFHANILNTLVNLSLFQILTPNKYTIQSSWSLSAEWILYLFFPFIFYLIKNKYALLGLSAFCFMVIVLLNQQNIIHGFAGVIDHVRYYSAILRCLASYCLGISVYYFSKNNDYSKIQVPILIVLLCMLCYKEDILIVFFFSLFVLSLISDKGIIAKILSSKPIYFLGEISYSIYLWQFLFFKYYVSLNHVLENKNIQHHTLISVIIFFVCLITFSTLTYYTIEKPSAKWLKAKLKNTRILQTI